MAATKHQSGFNGSIDFTSGGPTGLVTSASLLRWSCRERMKSFSCYAKGDVWETQFTLAGTYEFNFDVLIPVNVTPGTNLQVGMAVVEGKFNINAADYITATGVIVDLDIDDPLDGPVVAKMRMIGTVGGTALIDAAAVTVG